MRIFTVMFLALCLLGCGPAPNEEPTEAATPEPQAPSAGGESDESMQDEEMMGMDDELDQLDQLDPLTGTSWWVEDIGGGGVVDRSRSTVEFFQAGRVAGNSGCNRYSGGYERNGEALSFGMLAGTMMACPEALMNQERRFYDAMSQVTAWRIDPRTDLLHLLDAAGETVIRASRLPEDAPGS